MRMAGIRTVNTALMARPRRSTRMVVRPQARMAPVAVTRTRSQKTTAHSRMRFVPQPGATTPIAKAQA